MADFYLPKDNIVKVHQAVLRSNKADESTVILTTLYNNAVLFQRVVEDIEEEHVFTRAEATESFKLYVDQGYLLVDPTHLKAHFYVLYPEPNVLYTSNKCFLQKPAYGFRKEHLHVYTSHFGPVIFR